MREHGPGRLRTASPLAGCAGKRGQSPTNLRRNGDCPLFRRAPELASLRQKTTVINLAESADFERLFLESLYLEPIRRVKQP